MLEMLLRLFFALLLHKICYKTSEPIVFFSYHCLKPIWINASKNLIQESSCNILGVAWKARLLETHVESIC